MIYILALEIYSIYIFFHTNYLINNFTEFFSLHPLLGILYGLLTSFVMISNLKEVADKKLYGFSLCFLLSTLIPYHISPVLNDLHTYLAVIAIIYVIYILFKYFYFIKSKMLYLHIALLALIAIIFIHFSVVNSLLEIVVITYINFILTYFHYQK